ncbi:MAG: glycerophosphodiester phosphodiesterase family protein [Lachnospiraceae bacterium]
MKKVITYGTFDLFHQGHYRLLQRAKELGDYLIVGVTTEHFDEERGKINVVDSIMKRIHNVLQCGLADEIIIEDHEGQKLEDIQKYDIDIFTVGSDWSGTFDFLNQFCKVIYLDRTPNISSTLIRTQSVPIVTIGIVGSGRIAPRFLAESKFVSGVYIRGVYNPHRESAQRFEQEHEVQGFYGEFSDFLKEIDAIYIASPNETHYDYCVAALLHGVHVLCEKPLVFQKREAEELFALAAEKDLILMEGIKTAYCPGFSQLLNVVKSGKIGEVRDVEACFSRLVEPGTREAVDSEYGGAFLEYGSYTLLPILKLLGSNYRKVEIDSIFADNGIDEYTKIHIGYESSFALSKTGVAVKSEGQLVIAGTKGYILAESPWWLTKKFEVRYENADKIDHYTPRFLGDGLRYEISEFVSKINHRGSSSYKLSKEESIAMADIVEQFMEKRSQHYLEMTEGNKDSQIKIWAHRGCSYLYPENTLAAFLSASKLPGITGIELDVQMASDGTLVVFHDETLNRLMDHTGYVKDFSFSELRKMNFRAWYDKENLRADEVERDLIRIPSLQEVFEWMSPYCKENHLRINIELKNSLIAYDGMEELILKMVTDCGMAEHVVYSSFSKESVIRLKKLEPSAEVGVLDEECTVCESFCRTHDLDAIHPSLDTVTGLLENPAGWPVRVWNTIEPFFGEDGQRPTFDLKKLERKGITDLFTNLPERYLSNRS